MIERRGPAITRNNSGSLTCPFSSPNTSICGAAKVTGPKQFAMIVISRSLNPRRNPPSHSTEPNGLGTIGCFVHRIKPQRRSHVLERLPAIVHQEHS